METTQLFRFASIKTVLDADRLLLRGFSGIEELGRAFEYTVTLLDQQPELELDPDTVIGTNATLRLQLESDEIADTRYFNGIIASLTFLGHENNAATYQARLVPWLWLLSRTSNCRSFPDQTLQEILEEVFTDYGFTDFRFELTGSYQPKPFTVQYNETAFNFISRLLENDGAYYWWEHKNGSHTMVITDDMATHKPNPLKPTIEWRQRTGVLDAGYLYNLRLQKTVSTGNYELSDYNFKAPKDNLRSRLSREKRHAAAKFEHFEYPGYYREAHHGETLSNIRLQETQAQHETVDALVTARAIAAGYVFDLTTAERADQERRYLIVSTRISVGVDSYTAGGGGGGHFDCQIKALPRTCVFRPARLTPKPLVRGPQPALVVGPDKEEIYCDEFGRVKIRFYWDRRSDDYAKCSKWVRVSQPSAGGGYGFMSVPRVGQEVIVEFMNGDPDQPIITGRVYNGENAHPYDPRSMKSRSSWKTQSYPGGGGFNELRFEDAKGREQIFIHGQNDMDTRVLRRSRAYTGGSEHRIVGGDRLENVGRDKHETTRRHFTEEIKENHFTTVGGDDLTQVEKAFQVQAKESVRVVTDGDAQIISIGNISIISGAKMVLEAHSITLKCGGNFVQIDPSGVTIQGTSVRVNSGGSPTPRTDVPGKGIDKPKSPQAASDSSAGRVERADGTKHRMNADSFPAQTVEDVAAAQGRPFVEQGGGGGW